MPELHTAAFQGDVSGVLKRLDQHHDDIDSFALGHTTALMFAAKRHHQSVVHLLVERGCDVNIVNREGEDAVSILFSLFPYTSLSTIRFLLEKGAMPHCQRHRGLLSWALQEGDTDLMEIILYRNPQFSADVGGHYKIPVLHAVINSFQGPTMRRILALLLDHGANPFQKDAEHESAWALAQRLRKDKIVHKFRSFENGVWLYSVSRTLQKTDRSASLKIAPAPLAHKAHFSQKMVQECVFRFNYSLLQELSMFL